MAQETEVFDFADLSLTGEAANSSDAPTGDYPSIDEVINKPIFVTGYVVKDTEAGDGGYIVKFKWALNEAETAFFTHSKKLTKVLTNEGTRFPFQTIIKVTIVRDMCVFEFRSAREAVTQQDIENFEIYKIRKRSFVKQRR